MRFVARAPLLMRFVAIFRERHLKSTVSSLEGVDAAKRLSCYASGFFHFGRAMNNCRAEVAMLFSGN